MIEKDHSHRESSFKQSSESDSSAMNLTVNKSSARKENESRTEIEERKAFNECVPTELLLCCDQEIIENEQVDLFVRLTPLHVLSRLREERSRKNESLEHRSLYP